MKREEFLQNYWRNYLLLESKFLNTLNYVELSKDNFKTYSMEYVYILQSIGGELDTFFKIYCNSETFLPERTNIVEYIRFIISNSPQVVFQKIKAIRSDIVIMPFSSLKNIDASADEKYIGKHIPKWWNSYNKIKHNRMKYLNHASLYNVIYSLAALMILEMEFLVKITEREGEPDYPDDFSVLFTLVDWNCRIGTPFNCKMFS